MRSRSIAFQHQRRRRPAAIIGFTACALFIAAYARFARAEAAAVETFASPEHAAKALYVAVRDNDQDALTRILNIDKKAISSADSAQDRIERQQFARKYREMHRWVREPDGSESLHVGAENWPLPFPLVAVEGGWRFDADAGMKEVLLRRIGKDEMAAIAACRALVTEKQPAVNSLPQENVPAGSALTVDLPNDKQTVLFHGYYFRRIESGQPSAEDSARAASDISENAGGSLLLLAYPAEYRVTGVMTFAVDRDGTLYEADLGPQTVTVAAILSELDPTLSWYAVH
jgi:Protein of unknown function (DUF2950)